MELRENYHLIVGLGNPGKEFDDTRHNVGFMAVRAFAEKYGMSLQYSSKVKGEIALGEVENKKVILLMPTEYMNNSGNSVRLCAQYYKVPTSDMVVICDDIAIPFASCRFRYQGSSGGHNGLKSVESSMNTQQYSRLRIGIGESTYPDLADYVLSRFTEGEKGQLVEALRKVIDLLVLWLTGHVKHGLTISL